MASGYHRLDGETDPSESHHAPGFSYNSYDGQPLESKVPELPINLREHKKSIAIHWGVIFFTSCIVPLVIYPTLRYIAHLSPNIGTSYNSMKVYGSTASWHVRC
jgi:hypothetical protein